MQKQVTEAVAQVSIATSFNYFWCFILGIDFEAWSPWLWLCQKVRPFSIIELVGSTSTNLACGGVAGGGGGGGVDVCFIEGLTCFICREENEENLDLGEVLLEWGTELLICICSDMNIISTILRR